MPDLDLDQIRELATAFRRAVERTDRSSLIISLRDFPNGSCQDVALLLGTFLKDRGFEPFRCVSGRRGLGAVATTHAWIERPGILVDITADQDLFPEMQNQPVIVSDSSDWHATFERVSDCEADFHGYGAYAVSELERAYHAILANLETS